MPAVPLLAAAAARIAPPRPTNGIAAAFVPPVPTPFGQFPTAKPIFAREGAYQQAYARNKAFAKPNGIGGYQTPLAPGQEQQFRQWVAANKIPFDPNASTVDYDMRGFWLEGGGKGRASNGHFPDTYKTPYDTTFSNQSKYAAKNTPFVWRGNSLIDTRTGQVISK